MPAHARSLLYRDVYLDVGTATRDNLQIVPIDTIEALSDEVRNNDYKFWTVEHMYTKSQPSNLTTAFLNYIVSDQFRGEISKLDYVPINFMPANVISAHPSPPAPAGL
jgi:phosphate transport system substrate-binding protein